MRFHQNMLMHLRKVEELNNKKKVTIILIALATTTLVVAFFITKNQNTVPRVEAHSHGDDDHTHHENIDSVDHTISADMQVVGDTPVIKVDASGVKSEAEKWERKFFEDYIEDTVKNLPSLKQLQKLDEEKTHHTPAMIMETGLRLGKIKKQVKLNEEFGPKAISFYKTCASDKDGVTPVRGLCLANLIYMKKQKGEEVDLSAYPENVMSLAKKAMEFSF